jgi:hypothetical protein
MFEDSNFKYFPKQAAALETCFFFFFLIKKQKEIEG